MKIHHANSSPFYPGVVFFLALTISSLHGLHSFSLAATSFNATNLTASNPATTGYVRFGDLQLNDAGQAAFMR